MKNSLFIEESNWGGEAPIFQEGSGQLDKDNLKNGLKM